MAKSKESSESKSAAKGEGSSIKYCSCESPYQDAKYGAGQRVFNHGKANATCTQCGRKS